MLDEGPVGREGERRSRILVVEDDDEVRDLWVEALSDAGYSPVAVANGPEALARAAHCRVLHAYLAYYNTARPHQSLDDNSPHPRVVERQPCGRIIAIPQVGGLHHRYQRVA